MRTSRTLLIACVLTLTVLSSAARSVGGWPLMSQGRTPSQSAATPTDEARRSDAQAWFAKGQAALQGGELDAAAEAFRRVLALDPRAGAAYSNLGVIAMRRKDWDRAITLLRKAEELEPKMAGIRLNIGLVEYRRANYQAAIAPLASVLRDQPDSRQARYLLALCQVFTKHYAEAVNLLEPLWESRSGDVLYLYVYDLAAVESGRKELDEKILSRMVAVGAGTPEFHLIMGKSRLNRGEVPEAISELEQAAALNPSLPFVQLNLGIAYFRAGEYEQAERALRRDIELEPDVADTHEQLGDLYSRTRRDEEAEKEYREALARNTKMPDSYLGLAKVYQNQQKFEEALKMIDTALRLVPDIQGGHFLRGRILAQLGRTKEAQAELALAKKTVETQLGKEREKREQNRVPNPELTREPQP